MTTYGNIDLGQHWLVARLHQAITWINDDQSSTMFCGIPLRTISQVCMNLISYMCSEITLLKSHRGAAGSGNPSHQKSMTCFSYIVNIIAADDLAMQGARPSVGVVWT